MQNLLYPLLRPDAVLRLEQTPPVRHLFLQLKRRARPNLKASPCDPNVTQFHRSVARKHLKRDGVSGIMVRRFIFISIVSNLSYSTHFVR